MNFEPILYGPLFTRDAQDVNLVAASADPVDVAVTSGGLSWTVPVTPVLTGGRYLAPLRMRDILASVALPLGLRDPGVVDVPAITLSAGNASMSFRAIRGAAAGKTPAHLAGHWLSWRDQVSKTYIWGRERLTFLAGQDLLGWRSGTYSVSVKIFLEGADPVTRTLESGTLQPGCQFVTVDASYAAIATLVSGTVLAWDVSYSFSGTDNGGDAASIEGYPMRLVLARPDVRVKEFVFVNGFGVEDRVYSSGRSNPKLEGTSVAFLNGSNESELRNDAEEGREVYSGYLASARESALWLDFLKAYDRRILISGVLEKIVVDSQETDLQDNALGSVKFTYHLAALDAGRFFRDAEGLGDYDPPQQYGALYVGDDPASEDLPVEDLFFLKTRLDEFPVADLTEELLFLVQNPLTQAWGNAPLSGIKEWLQNAIHAGRTPVWSGPWEDYTAGVADHALAAALGKNLDDRIRAIEQSPYSLPIASDTVLGGVRVGEGLSIDSSGVLSVVSGGFFEPDPDYDGGIALKENHDALRVPGLRLGEGAEDLDLEVVLVNGARVLHSRLPFYSDSFISSGGLSDGPGSSGTTLEAVWQSLTNSVSPVTPDADTKINASHIPIGSGLAIENGVIKVTALGGVTSVVGQTGDVTTAQIASALTGAGYKLTDTIVDSLPWTSITGRPTNVSAFSNDAGYLTSTAAASTYVSGVALNGNYLRVTKNGGNTDLTIPYATNAGGVLPTSIDTEDSISASGIHFYTGSGSSWTGSVTSMGYAAILAFGNYSRGWQMWARRGAGSLIWRNGTNDATAWNTERTIWDSANSNSTSVAWSASLLTLNGAISGATTISASTSVTSPKFYLDANNYFEVVDGKVHLHVGTNGGFYTEGSVSAGGESSGGGAAGIDWSALQASTGEKINTSHFPSLNVGAGLTASYSTSGSGSSLSTALNLGIASGYKLPTTTEWGNKADASALGNYLPLAGGVMSGPIAGVTYLSVNRGRQEDYNLRVNGTSFLGGDTMVVGGDIIVGQASRNTSAGSIYFYSYVASIRNGFRIASESPGGRDVQDLVFYASNQPSPYTPVWEEAMRISYTKAITMSSTLGVTGNITGAAFIKSGGTASQFLKADGSVDSCTYLTGNQAITLSGDVSGSGTTSISVAIGQGKVTNAMLAGSIANSKLSNSSITINGISTSLGGSFSTASITAGTAGQSTASSGVSFSIPYVTMNAYGIVTGYGTHTHTITAQNLYDTIGSTKYHPYGGGSIAFNASTINASGTINTDSYFTSAYGRLYLQASDNRIYMRSAEETPTNRYVLRYTNNILYLGSNTYQLGATRIYGSYVGIYAGTNAGVQHNFTANGASISGDLTTTGTIYSPVGIYSDGYVNAGGLASSSDERLKANIADFGYSAAMLMALKPREWDWNEYSHLDGHAAGIVAQELQQVMPYAIVEGRYLSVNYDMLHALEIAGLQDHEKRIAALEKENRELRDEIKRLRTN